MTKMQRKVTMLAERAEPRSWALLPSASLLSLLPVILSVGLRLLHFSKEVSGRAISFAEMSNYHSTRVEKSPCMAY